MPCSRRKREKEEALVGEIGAAPPAGRPCWSERRASKSPSGEPSARPTCRTRCSTRATKRRKRRLSRVPAWRGAVTISTNMAGRGVDIQLGPGVADAGGLHVIGTNRHESRRIDNQLRGRAGRQGDPGSSQFFISDEDPLLQKFAADDPQLLRDADALSGAPRDRISTSDSS